MTANFENLYSVYCDFTFFSTVALIRPAVPIMQQCMHCALGQSQPSVVLYRENCGCKMYSGFVWPDHSNQ